MKDKVYYIIFLISIIYYSIFSIYEKPPVENLQLPSCVGVDVLKEGSEKKYTIGISKYIFQDNKIMTKYTKGEDITPIQARQKRQLKEDKQYVIGQEKVYVISEEAAKEGMKDFFDVLFTNNLTNDKALVVISKEKAEDVLKYNSNQFSGISNYIEELIKSADNGNFYSDKNSVINVYTKLDSKIKTLILPYIVIEQDSLRLSGVALFKNEKMITKVEGEETRILNLLSEDAGRGFITLLANENEFVDIYGKSKRKVKCWMEGGKLKFLIKVDIKGEVVTNEFNDKLSENHNVKKQIEYMAENKLENMGKTFINNMKSKYKLDCLNLSRIAAAKYGKELVKDWDEAILNSDIDIKVNVNIIKQGRGDY